jgi:signal transduction histidine kinase
MEFADDGQAGGPGGPGLGVGLENLEQRVRRFGGPDAHVEYGRRDEGGFVVRMRWPAVEGGRA